MNSSFAPPAVRSTEWRDRLVELHVLAEHGCPDSATHAEGWLAVDRAAHEAWHMIERTCQEVRTARIG